MRVTFLHPDLGIGGAERLVVDAAVALQKKGHQVNVVTAHHDASHSFPETNDGTLKVQVVGDWLPRSVFNKFYAFFAYLRMVVAAFYLCCTQAPDVIFCDQISACIPFIRILRPRVKILFYCHFPDQLLTKRETLLKKIYRYPIDKFEEWTTGLAHCVCVNSHFTANTFRETFGSLANVQLDVLFPTLNTELFDDTDESKYRLPSDLLPQSAKVIFLSLNRFERKKNIALAIHAFDELRTKVSTGVFENCHLVIAGGYDSRVQENVDHFKELSELADLDLNLDSRAITFVKSPDDNIKRALMEAATAVIYTPSNEHFGIVPIEAMYASRPVIAVNSGGPKETVVNEKTGFLTEPTPADFAQSMLRLVNDPDLARRMGRAGRTRVIDNFVFDSFAVHLDDLVKRMCSVQ
uniref:Alpha-1,3/1,6-mannosyltransferase ALG2 n=1 Tax=Plectus sambesii TaxID=2011161 RepID=A0A914W771_9BILA